LIVYGRSCVAGLPGTVNPPLIYRANPKPLRFRRREARPPAMDRPQLCWTDSPPGSSRPPGPRPPSWSRSSGKTADRGRGQGPMIMAKHFYGGCCSNTRRLPGGCSRAQTWQIPAQPTAAGAPVATVVGQMACDRPNGNLIRSWPGLRAATNRKFGLHRPALRRGGTRCQRPRALTWGNGLDPPVAKAWTDPNGPLESRKAMADSPEARAGGPASWARAGWSGAPHPPEWASPGSRSRPGNPSYQPAST